MAQNYTLGEVLCDLGLVEVRIIGKVTGRSYIASPDHLITGENV